MSTWTRENHRDARDFASVGHLGQTTYTVVTEALGTLNETLDELERVRPALATGLPEDRDAKVALFARYLWSAAEDVAADDTTVIPAFEDMTTRERAALAAITDSVVSAITVLLSSRQPGPEETQ